MPKPHNCDNEPPRRILIVDDDVDFAASLVDLLQLRAYQVTAASEPDEAMHALRECNPSVVMIDIRLGRYSGVEFLSRLMSEWPELICIMITAHAEMGTAVAALRLGAYDYYEKSSESNNLYAILDRAFEKCLLRQESRRSAEKLREQKLHLDTALNNMSQGLCMFDSAARLMMCNQRYIEMYGLSAEVVYPGSTLQTILKHRKDLGVFSGDPEQYCSDLLATITEGKSASSVMEIAGGRTIFIVSQPMDGGGWVATHEDITERRRVEKQIEHMARHDALTDLPNRVLLRDRLEQGLARTDRGEQMAVLFLDLDHFKGVNDSLGHPIGDKLLKAVGDRLRGCVRETDMVARVGGDEFAIIQTLLGPPTEAAVLARTVREAITAPYHFEGQQVVIDASIGIAVAPSDGREPDQLLKNADMALYGAKADGRGTYRFFEAAMDARVKARRTLELDLRAALGRGEFESYYQPIINVQSREISGVEALLRWHHPTRGFVSPAEFISAAEEMGLISQIGEWILRTACSEVASWPGAIKVAVNLSPVQFRSNNLVQVVVNALGASGLPASRLELEITEALLLQDTEATLATLHQLREFGVRIAMDDFGTGYSSLSYLRKFPFDKIKIDRCFIQGLSEGEDASAIIKAVADLARSLRMTTTAEGVETEHQLEKICAAGCTEVQGYLFSAPKPAAEVLRLPLMRDAKAIIGARAA